MEGLGEGRASPLLDADDEVGNIVQPVNNAHLHDVVG
jgi:hypothetical protein